MESIAVYDFKGRAEDELSFQCGTTVLIVNTAEDDNWYKAIMRGREGYIPRNYVDFTIPTWYWGKTSRVEAEKRLNTPSVPTGGFCVRNSESLQGAYSISAKGSKNVQHFKVMPDREGLYYIWLKKFKSLNQLVQYYHTHSINQTTNLVLRGVPLKVELIKDKIHQVKKCQALFDFQCMEEGEITLRRGDVIEITDDSNTSWWEGVCNGKQGLFPATYVEPIDQT